MLVLLSKTSFSRFFSDGSQACIPVLLCFVVVVTVNLSLWYTNSLSLWCTLFETHKVAQSHTHTLVRTKSQLLRSLQSFVGSFVPSFLVSAASELAASKIFADCNRKNSTPINDNNTDDADCSFQTALCRVSLSLWFGPACDSDVWFVLFWRNRANRAFSPRGFLSRALVCRKHNNRETQKGENDHPRRPTDRPSIHPTAFSFDLSNTKTQTRTHTHTRTYIHCQ